MTATMRHKGKTDQQARLLAAAKKALALLIFIGWGGSSTAKELKAIIAEIEND